MSLKTVSALSLALVLVASLGMAQSPAVTNLGTVTAFDVPGATNTFPVDINAAGVIVGRYMSAGVVHGFLRDPSGELTTIDYPGASFTAATSINAAGDIVGQYALPSAPAQRHGFLLRDGVFTSFDAPGSVFTNALGLNERGDIVGRYCPPGPCSPTSPGSHGYLLRDGVFTNIDVPGAARTDAWRINDRGQILGAFPPPSGPEELFVLSQGEFTTIALPGGQPVSSDIGGLNEQGDLVGTYCDASPCVTGPTGTHGFLISGSEFVTIDIPGGVATTTNGINARGDIVGSYSDGSHFHGFLLSQWTYQPWRQ
jgi:uncharacterized membrane protein